MGCFGPTDRATAPAAAFSFLEKQTLPSMGSHAKVDEEVEVHRTRTSVMREKFALFDINNDGVLTKEEIMHILTRPTANGARTFNTKMLNEFFLFLKFDEVDKDGNGVLSIDEFIDALLPKEARVVFNEFDKERQGKVKAENIPAMLEDFSMKRTSSPSSSAAYDKVLSEAAIDSSFSYRKFVSLTQKMRRTLRQHGLLGRKKNAGGQPNEEKAAAAVGKMVLEEDRKGATASGGKKVVLQDAKSAKSKRPAGKGHGKAEV